MGDHAHTTLLTWPYPGRWELPGRVLDELERHGALPAHDDPTGEDYLGEAGATVLAGDECSGRSWQWWTSTRATASPHTAA
jgi:hypothetical protein